MNYNEYEMEVTIWLYPGMAGWHFVTVPQDISDEIQMKFADRKRGWGSLPVRASIQATIWETSIFPDKKTNCYILPLKADVRKKEKLAAGSTISLILEIRRSYK